MGKVIVILVIILAIAFAAFMYCRAANILKRIDKMLDSAVNNSFSEDDFTEAQLSKLESKMYRYLTAGKTARNKISEEQNAVKALVSDISHQTKTPIANILLYTDLLKEQQGLNENAKELISNINIQTAKLNFLIQSLVKVSRLENGIVEVVPRKNLLNDLFDTIDFTQAAMQKHIELTVEKSDDLTAVFDLKWTGEALSNIIDNALKYTPEGGRVSVSASEYEMFVRIDIADTGIGMSEEETAKIFMRFYRSPAVSDEKGVGIGLYLAREIISKEGGYVKVSSNMGKGSMFSIFLPKN